MNRQSFACIGAFSVALVVVMSYGGWMQGKSDTWPFALAFSLAACALLGLRMRFVLKDSWRKER